MKSLSSFSPQWSSVLSEGFFMNLSRRDLTWWRYHGKSRRHRRHWFGLIWILWGCIFLRRCVRTPDYWFVLLLKLIDSWFGSMYFIPSLSKLTEYLWPISNKTHNLQYKLPTTGKLLIHLFGERTKGTTTQKNQKESQIIIHYQGAYKKESCILGNLGQMISNQEWGKVT